ncbi:MAG: alcohol dehydrogenase catalytic domain-containing protein [Treponema sp.]|nr:alcohol dehydrogenase catalytic domain-containing protein [Treponema sp.]
MKAAVVTGKCRVQIMEIGEPNITKPSQIKIKVVSGAVCNTTDNKVYASDFPEKAWPNESFPFIIGHECCGHIVELGEAVKDLKIGDRVVYWSVNGRAFADYCLLDTENAVGKISESVPNDLCAMMEMVIGAGRMLYMKDGTPRINQGDKVVVCGLGPAGLIYVKLAKLMGAGRICALGRRTLRLNKALELGADTAVDSEKLSYEEKVISDLGGHPDVFIDATGADIVRDIVKIGRAGMRVIPYGVPPFKWKERVPELLTAGIQAPVHEGVASARIALGHCVKWAENNLLDLKPIISHKLPLAEIGRGLDMCRLERDTTLKVIISINE